MQWTGPHTGKETDAIRVHFEYNSTSTASAGDALMWSNAGTPGFADRRLEITAGNTVDTDFTGYRAMPSEFNTSIAFPVMCGITEQDIAARALSTFAIQELPPQQAVAFGRVSANVIFADNVETGTPLIPDSANNGKLRPLAAGGNELNEPSFDTTTKWTTTGEFATGSGVATYTFSATGAGTLTQSAANRGQNAVDNALYRFSWTAVNGSSFDGTCTITTGFGATAVSLVNTSGTHSIEFTSAASASTDNFTIDVTGATVGTWTLDNMRLSQIGITGADSSLQHLVCGHLLEDWTGNDNELSDPGFAVAAPTFWTVNGGGAGDFAISGGGTAIYTHSTGAGSIEQTEIQRAVTAMDSTRYRLTFTGTAAGGFDGTATITNNFASVATALPITTGTHIVDFTTAAGASTADFVIDVTLSTTGTWELDDLDLEPLEGSVRIMARCI